MVGALSRWREENEKGENENPGMSVGGPSLLLAQGLELDEFIVTPAQREELVMRAGLADRPVLDEVDAVRVLDSRQPMRDRDRRAPLRSPVQRLLHDLF